MRNSLAALRRTRLLDGVPREMLGRHELKYLLLRLFASLNIHNGTPPWANVVVADYFGARDARIEAAGVATLKPSDGRHHPPAHKVVDKWRAVAGRAHAVIRRRRA